MLKNKHHGLFLRPGLGKTLVVLSAFDKFRKSDKNVSMLVVAPLRVCYNVWPQEIEKWGFDFTHCVLHGKGKMNLEFPHDIYIINYEGLEWFYQQIYDNPELCPDILILDESSKIKKPSAIRFNLLKNLRSQFKRTYILTGSPAANGYMGLWSQIYMLDGGKSLGAYITHYRREYFHKVRQESFNMYFISNKDKERVQRQIKPLVTHIPKSAVPLPPLSQFVVPVRLNSKSREVYRTMNSEMLVNIKGKKISAVNTGVMTGKLRQIANGIVFTGEGRNTEVLHKDKILALKEFLNEAADEPIIVAYEFVPDGDAIQKALKGSYRLKRIGGGGTGEKELRMWNKGELDILLVQSSTVSHGLNLQAAGRQLLFYGLTWDLEVYEQLIERLWRQGQENPVLVYHLLTEGTIDMIMKNVLEGKAKDQNEFLLAMIDQAHKVS